MLKFNKYLVLIFFCFLFLFRLHNALAYNPYWGYDGGGHIDYLFSLVQHHQFPDIAHNYVAWHEPLYYLIFASFLKIFLFFGVDLDSKIILQFLSLGQAILSIGTSFLIYKLFKLLGQNNNFSNEIIFFSIVLVSFLPSFNQASTFFTNELLSYFFILLALYYFLKYFYYSPIYQTKHCVSLGIILGLGLLTKITILILILCFLIYFFLDFIFRIKIKFFHYRLLSASRSDSMVNLSDPSAIAQGPDQKQENIKKRFFKISLVFILSGILYAPWLFYKSNNLLGFVSVNNPNFLTPQSLKPDKRLLFFCGFDFDIFRFPYYYSGARKFASMLYADFFWDYYVTIENQDFIVHARENNLENIIATNHNNHNFASFQNYYLNRALSFLSLFIFAVFVLGFWDYLVRIRKDRKLFFKILIPASFLAASIYQAYRYPYYDHGVVKAIFIFPAFLYLVPAGLARIKKIHKKLYILFLFFLSFYVLCLVLLYWIQKFNY